MGVYGELHISTIHVGLPLKKIRCGFTPFEGIIVFNFLWFCDVHYEITYSNRKVKPTPQFTSVAHIQVISLSLSLIVIEIFAGVRSLTFVDSAMGTDNFRSEALGIIEETKQAALNARVNKRQCQRLADRYEAVRESLEDNLGPGLVGDEDIVYGQGGSQSNPVITARDNKILTVLNRGKALVLRYQADVATIISSVLNWRSNQEAFKDIHEEIDSLKSELDLETRVSCNTHHRTTSGTNAFERISGEEREKVLRSDAEEDKKMMSQDLKELNMDGVDMKMVDKHLVQGEDIQVTWVPK